MVSIVFAVVTLFELQNGFYSGSVVIVKPRRENDDVSVESVFKALLDLNSEESEVRQNGGTLCRRGGSCFLLKAEEKITAGFQVRLFRSTSEDGEIEFCA